MCVARRHLQPTHFRGERGNSAQRNHVVSAACNSEYFAFGDNGGYDEQPVKVLAAWLRSCRDSVSVGVAVLLRLVGDWNGYEPNVLTMSETAVSCRSSAIPGSGLRRCTVPRQGH